MKRSDKIKQFYGELTGIAKNIVSKNGKLFPDLDELDIVDVLYYIQLEVQPHYNNYNDYILDTAKKLNVDIDLYNLELYSEKIRDILNQLVDVCRKK